ncbi:MAG: cyclic nucleotide-binding domain-containing protein [Deltaproteobacteria bacterium]|nr:cyclic nucleotide-binding domain-containing protein [Deltaproteobacteria bacterium]
MRIQRVAYRTEQGRERKSNHDGLLALKSGPLFAVADGNGGHDAARVVLETLKEQCAVLAQRNTDVAENPNTTSRLALGRFFEHSFQLANLALRERIKDTQKPLASTLVALTVTGPYAFLAHVGDSRAWLFRDGELRCLTQDHTLAALQLRRGDITPADYENSPFMSTLTQSLGVSPSLDVDIAEVRLMAGDVFLLATNGLHRFVAHARLVRCFTSAGGDLDGVVAALIEAAHEAGAPDNVTALAVGIERETASQIGPEALERAVRRVFLFDDFSDPDWLRVAPYLEQATVPAGEIVLREGDASDTMRFVAHGRVELRQGHERRELGPGGHFGSLALASPSRALDTVIALEPTVLFALSRDRFLEIVRYHPTLGTRLSLKLLESLGERLGTLTVRLAEVLEAVHGNVPTR